MKLILRLILVLCFVSVGAIGSLKAATADNEFPVIEEGWRTRKYLAVNFYDAFYGVDFTSLHAEMADQEGSITTALGGKKNNVALIRFSILTESISDGLKVYPNFYRLYSKIPRERGGRITSEEFVFVSGTHDDKSHEVGSGEKYKQINEELSTTAAIMEEYTRQYQSADMEDSILQFSQARQDAEELYTTLQKPITHPQNPAGAKEAIHRIAQLARPYSDSERHVVRAMHGKPLNKEMRTLLEEFLTEIKQNFIVPSAAHIGERVKTIIMHLHTQMDPCSTCGPMLLRELEGTKGFAKLWKERIARLQRGIVPDFILLASSREPHTAHTTSFTGRDNEHNYAVNASTFPPFYPLKRFSKDESSVGVAAGADTGAGVGARKRAEAAVTATPGTSAAASAAKPASILSSSLSPAGVGAGAGAPGGSSSIIAEVILSDLLPTPEEIHESRVRSMLSTKGGISLWQRALGIQLPHPHAHTSIYQRPLTFDRKGEKYIDAIKVDPKKGLEIDRAPPTHIFDILKPEWKALDEKYESYLSKLRSDLGYKLSEYSVSSELEAEHAATHDSSSSVGDTVATAK